MKPELLMIIGAATLLAAVLLLRQADGAEYYLSAQAGAGRLQSPQLGTYCNPKGLEVLDANQAGAFRVALGFQSGRWGGEIGAGRLGQSNTSLAFVNPDDDTVGEDVSAYEVDVRGVFHLRPGRRFQPYAFVQAAAIPWNRDLWTGHVEHCGYCKATFTDANAAWKSSSGTAFAGGGGLGLQYRLTKHVAVTAEYSGLWGQYGAQSMFIGAQWRF